EGVLQADSQPALYVYHQQFDYAGRTYTRRGFMARVRLEKFGEGTIYPHEETHASAKADRLAELLEDLSPKEPVVVFCRFRSTIEAVRQVAIDAGRPVDEISGDWAGLSGADALCQARASAAGLPGTYRAWLADSTGSPSTRFNRSTVPYVLTNNTVVANSWADLTDGSLASPINRTELNGAVPVGNTSCAGGGFRTAWSSVNNNGAWNGATACGSWTSTSAAATGASPTPPHHGRAGARAVCVRGCHRSTASSRRTTAPRAASAQFAQ
ncbi:MAG: DUF1015 family protein, partial [Caldilineaceae bacterium]|nr:DUF1015 family protein [Caldilineaceae bacterium]